MADEFPTEGSGLARYAARFDAAEINSTFYRPSRPGTFLRWAEATPPDFRFAVKVPRAITHEARLVGCGAAMGAFVEQVGVLGPKLGPFLVQLPPSLAHEAPVAEAFFAELRALWDGPVVCEPRHASWFEPEAEALLKGLRIARVAADPARHPDAARPGGWRGLAYWRLHGSPHMYRSPYEADALEAIAEAIRRDPAEEAWCVFDNTTSGAAAANALALRARLAAL